MVIQNQHIDYPRDLFQSYQQLPTHLITCYAHGISRIGIRNLACYWVLKVKKAQTKMLARYDQEVLLKLNCDASAYRMWAVSSNTCPDRSKRQVVYATRSLISAERKFAQVEKWVYLCYLVSKTFINMCIAEVLPLLPIKNFY